MLKQASNTPRNTSIHLPFNSLQLDTFIAAVGRVLSSGMILATVAFGLPLLSVEFVVIVPHTVRQGDEVYVLEGCSIPMYFGRLKPRMLAPSPSTLLEGILSTIQYIYRMTS